MCNIPYITLVIGKSKVKGCESNNKHVKTNKCDVELCIQKFKI
jgi:hypothetical protein